MPNYCLHVLRQESTDALVMAVSSFPVQDGLSAPTANYDSWDHLQSALLDMGITSSVLQEAQRTLVADGLFTFTDIPLSRSQLVTLGFGKVAELLAA